MLNLFYLWMKKILMNSRESAPAPNAKTIENHIFYSATGNRRGKGKGFNKPSPARTYPIACSTTDLLLNPDRLKKAPRQSFV